MIEKSQASCLASKRAFADAGEPVIILIGILMEFRDDSLPDAPVVTLYVVQKELSELSGICVMLGPECLRKIEQPSCIQPLREHIPGSVAHQHGIRNIVNDLLQLGKAGGPPAFNSVRIPEHKVTEPELLLHIISKLQEQCAGIFLQESHPELSCRFRKASL